MYSIDEFTQWAGELADELPECFFNELNEGIRVSERLKPHSKSKDGKLFILGEYNRSTIMGRGIVLYYGSFIRIHGRKSREQFIEEMRKTLRHEFRHHLESFSGERALEIEDEVYIQKYLKRFGE